MGHKGSYDLEKIPYLELWYYLGSDLNVRGELAPGRDPQLPLQNVALPIIHSLHSASIHYIDIHLEMWHNSSQHLG